MIKGIIEPNIVLLGLTPANMEQLTQRKPILIDMQEFGFETGSILLLTADSEDDAKEQIKTIDQRIAENHQCVLPNPGVKQ